MAERDLRKALLKRVKELGGEVRKVSWVGRRSAPDELVTIPGCVPFLIELKAEGKEPTTAQWREIDYLREAGFEVAWANTMYMFEEAVPYMRSLRTRLDKSRIDVQLSPWRQT